MELGGAISLGADVQEYRWTGDKGTRCVQEDSKVPVAVQQLIIGIPLR